MLAESRLSFLPIGTREVSSNPIRLMLFVDRMADLWGEISNLWEARQLFLQNRVSIGKK